MSGIFHALHFIYIYTTTFLYIFYTLHMMTTQLRLPWCCSEARRLGITLNAIPFAHSKDSTWRLSNGALCSGWKFIVTWLPALLHPCHFPALSGFPGTAPAATSYPTNRLWSRVSIWDTAAHWCKSYEDQWIGTIMRWRMIGSISCIFIIPNSIPNRSHLKKKKTNHPIPQSPQWVKMAMVSGPPNT